MPKFKTEKLEFYDRNEHKSPESLKFSVDIHINAAGQFYCNLDRQVVDRFREVGLDVGKRSRKNHDGFYESDTYEGLMNYLKKLGQEYVTKEIVSRVLMIEFSIETSCRYAFEDGKAYPNGYYVKSKDGTDWREGTIKSRFSYDEEPFGLQIYAKPFAEVTYRYRSGVEFKKKLYHSNDLADLGPNGKWLYDIVRQYPPKSAKVQSVEYTEATAGFFRGFFESLFEINERLQGGFTPERVKQIAEAGGTKFLT